MTAETLTVLVLFATVALRVALVLLVIWLLVPRRRRCPACGEETAALVTGRILTLLRFEKRWCLECGWWGLSKLLRPVRSHARLPTPHSALPRR